MNMVDDAFRADVDFAWHIDVVKEDTCCWISTFEIVEIVPFEMMAIVRKEFSNEEVSCCAVVDGCGSAFPVDIDVDVDIGMTVAAAAAAAAAVGNVVFRQSWLEISSTCWSFWFCAHREIYRSCSSYRFPYR